MLTIEFTKLFKKDYKRAIRRGCKAEHLEQVLDYLIQGMELPEKYRDHSLLDSRNFHNVRECHIEPDWLLVYQIFEERLVLKLLRTGTHSDLF